MPTAFFPSARRQESRESDRQRDIKSNTLRTCRAGWPKRTRPKDSSSMHFLNASEHPVHVQGGGTRCVFQQQNPEAKETVSLLARKAEDGLMELEKQISKACKTHSN